jgi:hypothetical protein
MINFTYHPNPSHFEILLDLLFSYMYLGVKNVSIYHLLFVIYF